jgi:hypothetical protein
MQGTSLLNIKCECSRLGSTLSISPLTFKLISFTFIESTVSLVNLISFMHSSGVCHSSLFDIRNFLLVPSDYIKEVLFDVRELSF